MSIENHVKYVMIPLSIAVAIVLAVLGVMR